MKIALPKDRLLAEVDALLQKSGWGLSGYHEGARLYRLKCRRFPNLSVKVFQEKDIPIQVAVGNYDLGICGLDWIEELLVKYPSSALVRAKNLGCGEGVMYMAASQVAGLSTLEQVKARPDVVRIASEYPNLAESFAVRSRLRRFNIFPVWGAAQVYPPESADLVLLTVREENELADYHLVPVSKVLDCSAFLLANQNSWETKDMAEVLTSIVERPAVEKARGQRHIQPAAAMVPANGPVRLALPDGHQQLPTLQLLNKAGIQIDDYPSAEGNRRPAIDLDGVMVKVIRPQDMPSQVANGNFDLAITGRDWLEEHLYQFPSSPVTELLDLKSGKVKIVAVVSRELDISDAYSLRQYNAERSVPLRVASEYINIADKYARDNHLGRYRVIPTWGASEAFLPEDADLLIENTQTGRTLARHNLKIIDTIFESTACLVGNTLSAAHADKSEKIKPIIEALQSAVEGC